MIVRTARRRTSAVCQAIAVLGTRGVDPAIDTYSGTISASRSEPNTGTSDPNDYSVISDEDSSSGIPRSIEAHSPNGMRSEPDGWLYSRRRQQNAGAPSQFFGNLKGSCRGSRPAEPEINLDGRAMPDRRLGREGRRDLTPFSGVFELYAGRLSQRLDLTWHSNGVCI